MVTHEFLVFNRVVGHDADHFQIRKFGQFHRLLFALRRDHFQAIAVHATCVQGQMVF